MINEEFKSSKLEELAKKYEEERKHKKELADAVDNDPTEDPEYIREKVKEIMEEINAQIDESKTKLKQAKKDEIEEYFLPIKDKFNEMRDLLTNKSFCLPPYLLQQLQQNVTKLGMDIYEAKENLLPKSRFAFKAKYKKAQPKAKVEEAKPETEQVEMKSDNDYYIEDKSDALIKINQQVLGTKENLRLKNLSGITLIVTSHIKALYGLNLINCKIYVGAVAGGSHLTSCEGCDIHLATHQVSVRMIGQLRIHKSKDTRFYALVRSNPIIEHCDDLHFGELNIKYEGYEEDLKAAGLSKGEFQNKYAEVLDFQWLKDIKNPHWDTEAKVIEETIDVSQLG